MAEQLRGMFEKFVDRHSGSLPPVHEIFKRPSYISYRRTLWLYPWALYGLQHSLLYKTWIEALRGGGWWWWWWWRRRLLKKRQNLKKTC